VDVPVRDYNNDRSSAYFHLRVDFSDIEAGYVALREEHSSSVSIRPEFSLYFDEAKLASSIDQVYIRHQFKPGSFELESSATFQRYQLEPDSAFINSFSAYQPAFKYADSSVFTARERLTVSITEGTTLLAGVMFRGLRALARTADLPVPFEPDQSTAQQELFYPGSDILDADGNSLSIQQDLHSLSFFDTGAFAQAQISEVGWMDITLGARFDNSSRYGESFNPRAAVVLKPDDTLRVKLLYGEAFLAPSPTRAFQHFGAFAPATNDAGDITGLQSFFFFLPNPELEPERFRSAEASVAWAPDSRVRFTVNGFYTRTTDLISLADVEENGEFKNQPVAAIQRFTNEGSAESYGGTFMVNALETFGSVTLNGYAAYTYLDGETPSGPLTQTSPNAI